MNFGTKRYIFISTSVSLAVAFAFAFWFSASEIKHERQLQIESFGRDMNSFASSLEQLATFLSEPGDVEKIDLVQRRLNRFIFGNAALVGIETEVSGKRIRNTHAASGQYLNEVSSLPICPKSDLVGSSAQFAGCESGIIKISRAFENFNGDRQSLNLFVQTNGVPGGRSVQVLPTVAIGALECFSTGVSARPCAPTPVVFGSMEFLSHFLPIFTFALFGFSLLALFLFRLVLIPIRTLNRLIHKTDSGKVNTSNDIPKLGIFRLFSEPVAAVSQLVRQKTELEGHAAANQARERITDQVIHNIRSPLAALHGVEDDLGKMPEEARVVFRSAVTRIEDIVNLLDLSPDRISQPRSEAFLASSLISVLLSEKRRQYSDRQNIEFRIDEHSNSYGIFVKVDGSSFKTVLSNLINNAVEAIPQNTRGKVLVGIRVSGPNQCEIFVKDTGMGMPTSIRERVTEEGFSHGKAGGKGVGLSHAKAEVASWSGVLEIESTEGVGTVIRIVLPRESAPDWFLPKLDVVRDSRIAVVDDDSSIHHLWTSRLGSVVKQEHFASGAELRQALSRGAQFDLLLVDYELIGENISGLDLILELGLAAKSVLVTSRFEDVRVRSACETAGLKLLPKGLASQVPLNVIVKAASHRLSQKEFFLDNDALVRQTWKRAAEKEGVDLEVFGDWRTLLQRLDGASKDLPVYLDFNLESDLNGMQVAEKLYSLGFRNLALATGARINDAPSWLRVVGKSPQFRKTAGDSNVPSEDQILER